MKPSRACQWIAESLNEYADLIDRGEDVPHHNPASPLYWFHGLVHETREGWKSPQTAALLSPSAVARLRLFGIQVAS